MAATAQELYEITSAASNNIAKEIRPLTEEVRNLNLPNYIKPFDGIDTSLCKDYIRDIERWKLVSNADDKRTILTALLTARGSLAKFIDRFQASGPEDTRTWYNLKRAILENFGPIADKETALYDLQKLKQRAGESLQMYLERILTLGGRAYPETESGEAPIQAMAQRLLVFHFVAGLHSETIRRAVDKAKCSTLEEAAKIAKVEFEVESRANWRTRKNGRVGEEEDMDISLVKKPPPCAVCGKRGHVAANCFSRAKVMNVDSDNKMRPNLKPERQGQRYDKKIICWFCGKQGHIQRNCWRNPQNKRQQEN